MPWDGVEATAESGEALVHRHEIVLLVSQLTWVSRGFQIPSWAQPGSRTTKQRAWPLGMRGHGYSQPSTLSQEKRYVVNTLTYELQFNSSAIYWHLTVHKEGEDKVSLSMNTISGEFNSFHCGNPCNLKVRLRQVLGEP